MRGIIRLYRNQGFLIGTLGLGYFLIAPMNVMFSITRCRSVADYVYSFLYAFMIFFLARTFVYELKNPDSQFFALGRLIDVLIISNHFVIFANEIGIVVMSIIAK